MAIYSVKARYIEEKMGEFYQKLTDGSIQNQKPDGQNPGKEYWVTSVKSRLSIN